MGGAGWAVFLVASLALAVTPGPGVFFIVARTLAQGRRAGFASVAGVALGNLGNAIGASLGLAALFTLGSGVFVTVQLAGAGYLVYLGVGALRSVEALPGAAPPASAATGRVVREGFVVALLNPKTALFFAAFLPQFIDPALPAWRQAPALGAVFVAIAAATDALYVLAAGRVGRLFARRRGAARWARRGGGLLLVGLGVAAAVAGVRTAR